MNKGSLTYDEFFKNINRALKFTHPETYAIFKHCISNEQLSVKSFFKALGGG